jgi:hypothetical protein
MTAPMPRSGTVLGFVSGFSTASLDDHSNIKPYAQIARHSSSFDAGRLLLTHRIAARQPTRSSHPRSGASSAAAKSP